MQINAIQNTTFMGQPMVLGNMKMNMSATDSFFHIQQIDDMLSYAPVELPYVGIAPTALAFDRCTLSDSKHVKLGAQEAEVGDVKGGAMTGAISQDMVKDNADFIIIGHSERRTNFDETDEKVNAKVLSALDKGMRPVICVGENLMQRQNNCVDRVIEDQVAKALKNVDVYDMDNVVIAYEPLWAINTGETCDSEEAQRVCSNIRKIVARLSDDETAHNVSILYGGSVKPNNAKEIFSKNDIDGGLVGGACLNADDFVSIVRAMCLAKANDIAKYRTY